MFISSGCLGSDHKECLCHAQESLTRYILPVRGAASCTSFLRDTGSAAQESCILPERRRLHRRAASFLRDSGSAAQKCCICPERCRLSCTGVLHPSREMQAQLTEIQTWPNSSFHSCWKQICTRSITENIIV